MNGSVYLDEAGNTGLNFLDPAQPTYVLGGWIVRADQIEAASTAVTAVSQESGSPDLKGSRMMHSVAGRQRVERLVRDLRQLGCYPVYSLYEKRYAVAAKIVEAFLDPVYNDHLLSSFEADVFAKQAVAQQLHDLPDGSLTPAWDAIRGGDAEQMRDSLNALVQRCRILRADVLAHSLAGAKSHVERIAAVLAEVHADPVGRHSEALPGTSLITIAGAIDSISKDMDLTRVEVVHDETSSFEPNLEWWFQLMSGPRAGGAPVRHRVPTWSDPEGRVLGGSQSEVRGVGGRTTRPGRRRPRRPTSDIAEAARGRNRSNESRTGREYAQLALLSDRGHPCLVASLVRSSSMRRSPMSSRGRPRGTRNEG